MSAIDHMPSHSASGHRHITHHLVPASVMPEYRFPSAAQPGYSYTAGQKLQHPSYAQAHQPRVAVNPHVWYPYYLPPPQMVARPQPYLQSIQLPTPPQVIPHQSLSTDAYFRPAVPAPMYRGSQESASQIARRKRSASINSHKEAPSIAEALMAADGTDRWLKNLELIPASASLIAPHPAIGDSGVPYATFAADLVWEICQIAREGVSPPSPQSDVGDFAPFGTIGGERTHRFKKSSDSIASLTSSFSDMSASFTDSDSTPPMTPPMSVQSVACPIPEHWQTDKRFAGEPLTKSQQSTPWSQDYWETSPAAALQLRNGNELASFRRFTEQLLTVTLVTPQTLLLAILYVSKIGKHEPVALARAFSVKSTPYKLLVGALVLANKVLDDNSYTSLTWSKVSSLPLKDVSAAESFIFDHLRFDIDIKSGIWHQFIIELFYRRVNQLAVATYKDPILARLRELEAQIQ